MSPQRLSDLKERPELMYLFKGESGTGKSIAAASFPLPMLYLDFDKRMRSVLTFFPNKAKEIEYETITDWIDAEKLIDGLERRCDYKTIVIDSLTNAINSLMVHAIRMRGKGKGSKIVTGVGLNTVEDYNAETRWVMSLLETLKKINDTQSVNIIVSAHEITVTYAPKPGSTQEARVEKFIVTTGKKLAPQVPTMFDEVYHFYCESDGQGVRHKVRTFNDGETGARTSFLIPGEIDFTNAKFYDIISPFIVGGMKRDEEEVKKEILEEANKTEGTIIQTGVPGDEE